MNAHKDIKFLPDHPFYKSVCLILCDLFGYRAEMTIDQFFKRGLVERKIMMVLNIYDIMKKVRKGTKINNRLTRREQGAKHATDESYKQYQVVDHQNHVSKSFVFKINPEMQKRQITLVE